MSWYAFSRGRTVFAPEQKLPLKNDGFLDSPNRAETDKQRVNSAPDVYAIAVATSWAQLIFTAYCLSKN